MLRKPCRLQTDGRTDRQGESTIPPSNLARKTSRNPKHAKIIAKIPKIILLQKKWNLCREVIQQATCLQNLKNLS